MQPIVKLVIAGAAMFATLGLIAGLSGMYSLNIRDKTVGHGQHGTARWATKGEIKKTYVHTPFEPELWRKGEHLHGAGHRCGMLDTPPPPGKCFAGSAECDGGEAAAEVSRHPQDR